MPTFQYEALNETGKPTSGSIAAANHEEAISRIRSQGFFPTAVREQKVKKSGASVDVNPAKPKKAGGGMSISIGKVRQKTLVTFTRQMSTLQDAGLPILRSLAILEQQQKPGGFKNMLAGVHDDVSGGATLSDAMAKHPKAFDKLYTKMIAAGEVGGVLDLILQRLADFMEKAAKLKRRIIGAMVYPAVVILVASAIVLGIMILIVPKFEAIFDDFGTELPGLTLMLMNFSRWIGGRLYPNQWIPGWLILLGTPFMIFFGLKLIKSFPVGKKVIDTITIYIPIFGQLVRKSTIARFTRTLGTLVSAGVPILDAITITKETTANAVYADALQKVHDSVRQGDSFAEPLRQSKTVDAIVVNMVDVGEETGDLDKMLMKIADNYDEEVDVMVDSLVSLLEPVMVVALGGIVGFIVVALFLPMVKLITSLT